MDIEDQVSDDRKVLGLPCDRRLLPDICRRLANEAVCANRNLQSLALPRGTSLFLYSY